MSTDFIRRLPVYCLLAGYKLRAGRLANLPTATLNKHPSLPFAVVAESEPFSPSSKRKLRSSGRFLHSCITTRSCRSPSRHISHENRSAWVIVRVQEGRNAPPAPKKPDEGKQAQTKKLAWFEPVSSCQGNSTSYLWISIFVCQHASVFKYGR
jgi:hypothetical protein